MEALIFAGLFGAGLIVKRLRDNSEGFSPAPVPPTVGPLSYRNYELSEGSPAIPDPSPGEGILDATYQTTENQNMTLPIGIPTAAIVSPITRGLGVTMNPPGLEKPPVYNTQPIVSKLSGQTFAPGAFTHNNMVPFYKGSSSKQNTVDGTNTQTLNLFTGIDLERKTKQELGPMFDTANTPYGVPFGTPSVTSFQQSYMIPSRNRAGEKPFEEVRVGPGLGQGYSATPSGGFGQDYTGEIMRAAMRDTNDIRPGNHPKLSYGAMPFTPAKAPVTNRGLAAPVAKNRPETEIYNVDGRWDGPATAANAKAETRRPVQVLPDTARQETTTEYTGTAGNGVVHETYVAGSYHSPHSIQFGAVPYGAADASYQGIKNTDTEGADYGKSGIEFPVNERASTQCRSQVLNPLSQVPAGEAPMAPPRHSRKEDLIDNPQEAGYLTAAMPYRPTARDSNDIPLTTIKETNVHNVHTGVMTAAMPARGVVHDPSDVTRTTIKETEVELVHEGFMNSGAYKTRVYDSNDIARTTIKETSIDDGRIGIVGGAAYKNVVHDPEDITRTTGRQTLDPEDYVLNPATGVYRLTARDASDITRTTVKETTEDDDHVGIVGGMATHSVVYDPADIARITLRNATADVDPWLNTAPAVGQTAPKARFPDGVRPTQKAQLSNHEYAGNPESAVPRAQDQTAEHNMRLNTSKERIARGRTPTRQGAKLITGKDKICIQAPKRPVEEDLNNRAPGQTRVMAQQTAAPGCVRNRTVCQPTYRFTADIVSQLANNPYNRSVVPDAPLP